eukprot:Rhum_TRINITY_DN9567_c0_g1::Rhum_TRINITY_DN9567_c0_g1_i1::g.34106::m.34106
MACPMCYIPAFVAPALCTTTAAGLAGTFIGDDPRTGQAAAALLTAAPMVGVPFVLRRRPAWRTRVFVAAAASWGCAGLVLAGVQSKALCDGSDCGGAGRKDEQKQCC